MKRYYFETNSIYKIGKVPTNRLHECYTSYLTIFEIVSGIREESFEKRRNILSKIYDSKMYIDWSAPEKIMLRSFNVANNYDISMPQVLALKKLVRRIIYSTDFTELIKSVEYINCEFNHNFFSSLDNKYSKDFIRGTEEIHKIYRDRINGIAEPFTEINKEKPITNMIELSNYLRDNPSSMYSIGIFTYCDMVIRRLESQKDLTVDEVYGSFNHLSGIYLQGFNDYEVYRTRNSGSPAKNDFLDITHLMYLYNDYNRYIISDDNIFDHVMSDQRLTFEEFLKF